MDEIGFLGIGIMGKAMAINLIRNGFKLTVWNRTLSRCDELKEHGASVGESPAAVVKKCNYTIGMLSDPAAAVSVVFDKDGVLEGIDNSKGYIDMSTVDADTSSKISEAIANKGSRFLEAQFQVPRNLRKPRLEEEVQRRRGWDCGLNAANYFPVFHKVSTIILSDGFSFFFFEKDICREMWFYRIINRPQNKTLKQIYNDF